MGVWIESHQDLRTNPKARRLARILDVPLAQAIGHLHMLWWWAIDHASDDGDVTGFDAYDIADAAGWEGDQDTLVKALLDCGPGSKPGFLEPVDNGRIVLHNWPEYTMALRASREGAARGNHTRWHTRRGITDPSCPFCVSPPDSPLNRPRVTPDVAPESPPESSRARGESTDPPTDPPEGPAREPDADHPDDPPPDTNSQPTPTRWDHAWARIERYVRRYGQHDHDRPPLDLGPIGNQVLAEIGGLSAVRRDDANRFDFRDAWQEAKTHG